ncbi:Glu-tRNA(Gln) amidotransferase subunit GatE [Candidatus Woesearchaeota archaeon]|nr:Glu-tRNA(Gln) amidotransferase subunit GatE [Candidatus Woesearchaeota archaeon]
MEDWGKLGFKAGLEIHQQLAGKKLFCDCPAKIVEQEPDITITRKIRATAGETGKVDVAAAHEQAKQKSFSYQAFNGACCLVELDEEPPHPVNPEAIKTAVMVSKIFNSHIQDKVQFMRKTIVDGSNVAGFQRTTLIALGGTIPDSDVRIQTVCVEEDSAKIISRTAEEDTYNLSRLGIPLIEIATEPDIKTPQQVKEVAATLGMILRSTGRVKRGLGTIRQDVNVSIEGGARIEIKGAQDLKMIPMLVENEVKRQLAILSFMGTEIQAGEPVDLTEQFKSSELGFISSAIKKGRKAVGITLKGLSGELGKELYPGYRLGTELAGLAKTRGFGGIIHSDEKLGKYGVGAKEMEIKRQLDCSEKDAFIIVIGEGAEELLTEALIPRLQAFSKGVPNEVRKANEDGTTSYLRPMPGGARMYPETDIPLVDIPKDVKPPKLLTQKVKQTEMLTGLSKDLAQKIVEMDIPIVELHQKYPNISYKLLTNALIEWPQEISSKFKKNITDEHVMPLLQSINEGKITGSAIKLILEKAAKEDIPPDKILELTKDLGGQLSDDELRAIIKKVIQANPGIRAGGLMGDIMKEVRGKADGHAVKRILDEEVQ